MNDCRAFQDLIEEYLDGMIDDRRHRELKAHVDVCAACAQEFRRAGLMRKVIMDALAPEQAAQQAKVRLLAKLSHRADQQPQRILHPRAWATWARMACAAGVLLTAGLLLGLALGRMSHVKPAGGPLADQVPIRVASLLGTVLVRYDGTDVWHMLTPESAVHLGDTFHSMGTSEFVLELQDRSTIQVDQNSMLVLKSYNGETQFYLEHGELTAALESPHPPFFISTPHGRVEALGTEFTVTVE